MSKKLNIEMVKERVYEIAGYTLLDNEYINNYTKMTAIDDDGYKYYFTLANLMYAKAARMVDISNPYSIENIKLWLKLHGYTYELLSTKYKGNGTKNRKDSLLLLRCENGHEFKRTWNDMQKGIMCEECVRRFINEEQFLNHINSLYGDEYEVIDKYINSSTKIKVRHVACGNEFDIRPEHFANGHGCPNSLCCKKRGKEHYRYNEDLTDEERMQDRSLNPMYDKWRFSVYKLGDYRCDICGNKNSIKTPIVAHHLFSWDVHEDKRFDVANGVTLCKEHHIDFHKKHGYGKNTPDQYYDYKKNYGNTEVINQIA